MENGDSILLVTRDASLEAAIRGVFMQLTRPPRLLIADTIERATIKIREHPPDALILDGVIGVEETNFVHDFQTMLPHANILLISQKPASCAPLISNERSVRFLPKPLPDPHYKPVLLSILHPDWDAAPPSFEAHLIGVQLADILQLKINSSHPSRLEILGKSTEAASIDFVGGQIVAAQVGKLEGPQAFCEIMRWRSGSIIEKPLPAKLRRNITMPTTRLLLDAAVSVDEAGAAQRSLRGRHKTDLQVFKKRLEKLHASTDADDSNVDFESTPKILIVEDNAFVLSFLEVLMGELYPNHIILCAPNGADGIECALLYPPELVVLDRTLPDISAEIFYKKLRKQEGLQKTPVLVISGAHPTSAEWTTHFGSGPAKFLKKPFTAEDLRSAIKVLMPEAPPRKVKDLP